MSISFDKGLGRGIGVSGSLSITGDGLSGYVGAGLGVGTGVSVTSGISHSHGDTSGVQARGSISSGNGSIGIHASGAIANDGGSVSNGVGWGLGLGVTGTIGLGGDIVTWPDSSDGTQSEGCDC